MEVIVEVIKVLQMIVIGVIVNLLFNYINVLVNFMIFKVHV